MLEIVNLKVKYGAITALHGISFSVNEGEIVTLLGANGAGKSTTLRTISGLIPPVAGNIHFLGTPIGKLPPHEIVKQGIVHAPEGRGIFSNLTVRENLALGGYLQPKRDIPSLMKYAFQLFPLLEERQYQNAGTLSGGEQQMLTISRALMGRPKLLLLDEPSLGLAPQITKKIFDIIKKIHSEGTSILLVEQNTAMALQIADRGYVLETGKIVLSGAAEQLKQNPKVKEAYLGE